MNDQLHLPPEGRLTDQQRAVMRANLMAATHETTKTGRRWLAPLAVAASVAVLAGAGIAGNAVLSDIDANRTTGVPVAGTTSAAPERSEPPNAPTPGPAQLDGACANQVPADARVIDSITYSGATTYLLQPLAPQGRWLVCDDWAAKDGGLPSLFAADDQSSLPTEDKFRISQNFVKKGGKQAQYVAGGAALDGVASISYTFPTGDVVDATITDAMWQMVYLLSEWPQGGDTEPVLVTVLMEDGSKKHFELTTVEDLCAQTNHGC
jgi:hypothetical protein